MQIKLIHKMQNAFDKAIKLAKFTWRHFFVCCVFSLLLMAYIYYPAINWELFGLELVTAIFFDWLKTRDNISNSNSSNRHHHQVAADYFRKHSEWVTNPAKIGSPANHLYNLGYNPGKYH